MFLALVLFGLLFVAFAFVNVHVFSFDLALAPALSLPFAGVLDMLLFVLLFQLF